MSHSQKIKTNFIDLPSLKAALSSFGWTLAEKSKAKTYPSDPARSKVYDYTAVNPNTSGYDLGFMRESGKLEAYGDFYGGSLAKAFGSNLSQPKKAYSKSVFTREWEAQGYTVFSSEDSEGNILLEAELA